MATNNPASPVIRCGDYSWNGQILVSGGIYRDTFPSATGCDSVAELDLTLTKKTSIVIDTACGVYNWNDVLLTATGSYTDTLKTATGCDSVVTLTLAVLPKPLPSLEGTVLCTGDTLRLAPGSFISYSWNDNSTASSLLIHDTGTYWVHVIDSNQCQASDTVRIMQSGQCECSLGQETNITHRESAEIGIECAPTKRILLRPFI